MRKVLLLLLVNAAICPCHKLAAQNPALPDFGNFSEEEMTMKECSFDKTANAVMLIDQGNSSYDDDYQMISERRVRIKVLNEKGISEGDISIPFYSNNNFESVSKIEGVVFTPGSGTSNLSRKSVYTEKRDQFYSLMKFAMPNVKAGSIIEYKYQVIAKSYVSALRGWQFQSYLPVGRSCFELQVIPRAEFNYVLNKKREYNAIVDPKGDGRIYFEMDNIPGLRAEPFMDSPRDYYQQVEFQLSGYVTVFGDKKNVNQTWQQIALDLHTYEGLGVACRKNISIPADLTASVMAQPGEIDKVNVIFQYVKDNFTWNGYDNLYIEDGISKTWEKHTGSNGAINIILVNLLRSFKLDALPLLVAERGRGKINPAQPMRDRFNKTVALVEVGGQTLILDATRKYSPTTLTPYPLLNTLALPIDKRVDELIQIGSNNRSFRLRADLNAKLDNQGLLNGNCSISSFDYAKEKEMSLLKSDGGKSAIRQFEEGYEGLKLDTIDYVYDHTDTLPLKEHFVFNNQLSESGGFVLFNYNFFTGLSRNPFVADQRFSDIDFGYPYDIEINETIDLPAGARTDDLLKDKVVQTSDRNIVLSREIRRNGNQLNIKIHFLQNATMIAANSYFPLKGFYQSMVEMLNEPVVIKL